MAFEGLTEKLSAAFKKLRGKGRLSEADVKEAMKEIRMALLEADVNFKVVKQFVATVTERAIGSDVLESLTPAQMIVKIVNEELTALMGGENTKLTISPKPPTVEAGQAAPPGGLRHLPPRRHHPVRGGGPAGGRSGVPDGPD